MIDFSIVIPTKNEEKNIKKCLESIFSQKNLRIEILIIDGYSSDKTIVITKEIKKNKNIIIKNIFFKGPAEKAIAKGIHLAKGKYIVFLGADDRLYSYKTLYEVNKIFKNKDIDIIYGGYQLIKPNEKKIKNIIPGEIDYKKILNAENYICATSLYFRNSIFNKVKKSNDDGYDFAFILKTFDKFKVYKTTKILSKFKIHPMSNSGNFYKNLKNIEKDWEISKKYGGYFFNNYHRRLLIIKILSFFNLLHLAEYKRKLSWKKMIGSDVNFKKDSKEVSFRLKQKV